MNQSNKNEAIEAEKKSLETEFNNLVFQIGINYLETVKIKEQLSARNDELNSKMQKAQRLMTKGNKLMSKNGDGKNESGKNGSAPPMASDIQTEVADSPPTQ